MKKNFEIPILECLRCGHKWIPRKVIKPKVCPGCNSPYWDRPKWKGVKDMNKELFASLWGILKRLAEDCGRAIQPEQCILEETREGTAYHFRVPNRSRRQIVGWAHLRPGGSTKLGASKPCVTVGVYAGSLNVKQSPFSNYFHPNANYGPKGLGEVQAAICEVDDANYRLVLKALIEASKAL